jgi:hypothetical protein
MTGKSRFAEKARRRCRAQQGSAEITFNRKQTFMKNMKKTAITIFLGLILTAAAAAQTKEANPASRPHGRIFLIKIAYSFFK